MATGQLDAAGRADVVDPAGRPAAGAADLRAEPAGARLLLGGRRARRRPLPDRRHRPGAGARRARARPERHRRQRPELVQPAHRLHARQRRDRGVRQPAPRRRHRPSGPASSGPRVPHARRARARSTRSATTRPASTSASRAPTTRSSARRPRLADVELDLQDTDTKGDAQDATTTYDGEGGVPVGGFFNQLMYAVKFGEPELPALRAGQRQQPGALQPRPRATGWRRSRRG